MSLFLHFGVMDLLYCLFTCIMVVVSVFCSPSGRGLVYHIEPVTGALAVTHELQVPSKDYPDASATGGAITCLAWTPDECAIVAAWSKGGVAVWSVFGALLFCSLQSDYGLVSLFTLRELLESI